MHLVGCRHENFGGMKLSRISLYRLDLVDSRTAC